MPAESLVFLVCHGAWSAGWSWRKMRPLLHSPPHSVLTAPTCTGVGERAHLGGPHIDLETHIADMLAVIQMEDLNDITLIGHSYGGMVATGVADRARGKVRRLIYLDAFVPENGESVYAITGRGAVPPDTPWQVPSRPNPPDTSEEDLAWIAARRTTQPLGSFTTPIRLSGGPMPPRAYIRCRRTAPDDPLKSSWERAKRAGWPLAEIDASHSPQITAPDLLAKTLLELCDRT